MIEILYIPILGLKEKLAIARDYNQMMKDIPINELLSATNLDEIKVATQNIMTAWKKLRTTKYPPKRAVQFLSAISSDLCQHMIQVDTILIVVS